MRRARVLLTLSLAVASALLVGPTAISGADTFDDAVRATRLATHAEKVAMFKVAPATGEYHRTAGVILKSDPRIGAVCQFWVRLFFNRIVYVERGTKTATRWHRSKKAPGTGAERGRLSDRCAIFNERHGGGVT